MSDTSESFRTKVNAIFEQLAGSERAHWLGAGVPSRVMEQIASAVHSESEHDWPVAGDIGFHVADWHADAAFVVALHLFPERFTPEEIDDGVRALLLHAPAHIMAAARLAGHPAKDIFDDTNAA
jgi:hypothetical protein